MSNHGLFATQRSRAARIETRPLNPQGGSIVTAPQITASVNDYSPIGWDTCDILRISSSAVFSVTGMRMDLDCRQRSVWNVGSYPILLIDSSPLSRIDNRFSFSSDMILQPDSGITIQYDSVSRTWRFIGNGTSVPTNYGLIVASQQGTFLS